MSNSSADSATDERVTETFGINWRRVTGRATLKRTTGTNKKKQRKTQKDRLSGLTNNGKTTPQDQSSKQRKRKGQRASGPPLKSNPAQDRLSTDSGQDIY